MHSQIVKIDATDWRSVPSRPEWTEAVEAGKVLYFPQLMNRSEINKVHAARYFRNLGGFYGK